MIDEEYIEKAREQVCSVQDAGRVFDAWNIPSTHKMDAAVELKAAEIYIATLKHQIEVDLDIRQKIVRLVGEIESGELNLANGLFLIESLVRD